MATPESKAETEAVLRATARFGAAHVGPARTAADACEAALRLERRRGRTSGEREAKARTGFYDQAAKLIFDIGQSQASGRQPEVRALLSRFEAQGEIGQRPSHLSAEEWKERRLSEADVIEKLQAILSDQHGPRKRAAKRERLERRGLLPGPQARAEDQVQMVMRGADLQLKGYTPEGATRIERRESSGRSVSWNAARLAISDAPLPKPVEDSRYAQVIRRKRALRRRYEGDLMGVKPPEALVRCLRSKTIEHPDKEAVARGDVEPRFSLTELQASDVARVLTRRHALQRRLKGKLASRDNPFRGQPYPAYHGERVFSASFAPCQSSVFGILTQDQDIYNADSLTELLKRTRIVRTFAEIAGPDQFSVRHHPIALGPYEETLHERIMVDFARMMSEAGYFEDTGNARKEAGLRPVRQLRLLTASAQHPHLFPHYEGDRSTCSRKMQTVRQMVEERPGRRVAVGLQRKEAFERDYLEHWAGYLRRLGREVFVVRGSRSPARRGETTKRFQASKNGVMVATQQSLPSSINVPHCNEVILPEISWNWPQIDQRLMRFVRFDMPEKTHVHLVTYQRSIESNLLGLNSQ